MNLREHVKAKSHTAKNRVTLICSGGLLSEKIKNTRRIF